MALPGQSITVADGGVGSIAAAPDRVLVVGISSAGSANTIYTASSKSKLQTAAGRGPGIDAAAHILDVAGGTVDFLKTAGSVAAANSAVVKTGTGPNVTISGTGTNHYTARFEVMLGGALGVGRFKYTLDDRKTWSETLTIPAGGSYAIPNTGITATFAAGTYVLGDTYDFTITPAIYNSTDLTNAFATVLAASTRYKFILFAGRQADATTAATIAGAISSHLTSLANQVRYTRAIVDAGNDTAANVVTAFASYTDARVMVVYSRARVEAPLGFAGYGAPYLPFAVPVAARCSAVRLSTSPAWVGKGNLPNVSSPEWDEWKQGETLHNVKIVAPRTIQGYGGVFATNGLLKSGPSSDFRYWQWGLVMDRLCHVVHDAQMPYVNSSVRAKLDGTGSIDSRDAARINKDVRGKLKAALLDPVNDFGSTGHVSGVDYAVDETNDILATGILQSASRAVPLPQVEQIATDVGFARELFPAPEPPPAA